MRQTSITTYNQIMEEGLLSKKRRQVYDVLYKHGPMTGGELAFKYRRVYGDDTKYSESIRNRLTELCEREVICEVETRACKISGRTSIVWEITNKLPVKPEKKLSNAEKIKRLKKAYKLLCGHVSPHVKMRAYNILKGEDHDPESKTH